MKSSKLCQQLYLTNGVCIKINMKLYLYMGNWLVYNEDADNDEASVCNVQLFKVIKFYMCCNSYY